MYKTLFVQFRKAHSDTSLSDAVCLKPFSNNSHKVCTPSSTGMTTQKIWLVKQKSKVVLEA